MADYLTTKELAALLRIKERKVYDLAATGEVPCSKAMGKLLFPRKAVEAWIVERSSGLDRAAHAKELPNVFLGSHDPLLEWALRNSRCGIATFFDGSMDGMNRFAERGGIAVGLHIYDPPSAGWNVRAVMDRFAAMPVVLVGWAKRQRGLIVRKKLSGKIAVIADLKGYRFAPRQPESGAQVLLAHMLKQTELGESDIDLIPAVRTEDEAALAVLEGKADAAFGLASLAAQYQLPFAPLFEEQFDLLVDRRSWFEPAMQIFLNFCRSDVFHARASELAGYDVSEFGHVRFNGVY